MLSIQNTGIYWNCMHSRIEFLNNLDILDWKGYNKSFFGPDSKRLKYNSNAVIVRIDCNTSPIITLILGTIPYLGLGLDIFYPQTILSFCQYPIWHFCKMMSWNLIVFLLLLTPFRNHHQCQFLFSILMTWNVIAMLRTDMWST